MALEKTLQYVGSETTNGIYTLVRRAILASGRQFAVHGATGQGDFRGVFRFDQMDIFLEHESGSILDSDNKDKVLNKPRLVLYQTIRSSRQGNSAMHVEAQIIVNTVPTGRIELDGYSQLCLDLFQPPSAEEGGGSYWSDYGLIPLEPLEASEVYSGDVFDPLLRDKILTRSVAVIFRLMRSITTYEPR